MFDYTTLLGMPPDVSAHGYAIDNMMGLVHWLMLFLFLFWAPFFLYTLYRFRAKKQPRANYHGVTSKFSTYLEGGVVVAEAVLLVGFAFPIWGQIKNDCPAESESTIVHVVAEQFAWNVHYPGPDGVFGTRNVDLIDVQTNPLGLDRDNDPNAVDDVTTVNELYLPVDKPVILYLSSKDVIHSLGVPQLRIKQDAIPGLVIPMWFEPTMTTAELQQQVGDDNYDMEIACAQLCGLSHYRMRGFVTVQTQAEFDAWMAEEVAKVVPAPPPPPTEETTEEGDAADGQ